MAGEETLQITPQLNGTKTSLDITNSLANQQAKQTNVSGSMHHASPIPDQRLCAYIAVGSPGVAAEEGHLLHVPMLAEQLHRLLIGGSVGNARNEQLQQASTRF